MSAWSSLYENKVFFTKPFQASPCRHQLKDLVFINWKTLISKMKRFYVIPFIPCMVHSLIMFASNIYLLVSISDYFYSMFCICIWSIENITCKYLWYFLLCRNQLFSANTLKNSFENLQEEILFPTRLRSFDWHSCWFDIL